jgi:hypothetical protein
VSLERRSNLAASVRQRLLNVAKARREDFQRVLTRYGVERLLYRLGHTSHGDRFVLKGAMLFVVWDGVPHRPTRDVDLLGYGDSTPQAVADAFRAACAADVEPDGLAFDPGAVLAEPIRDRHEYGGIRVTLVATLGTARIPLQVDVGFGDAVTPAAEWATFPALLPDLPAPRVRTYPAETVVAEKFQAMVALGIANTRLKDFYDLWLLAGTRPFDGALLAAAIAATFARRGTALPGARPLALSDAFARDRDKQAQWRAFLSRTGVADAPADLADVAERLAGFVLPPAAAARDRAPLRARWTPLEGWIPLR